MIDVIVDKSNKEFPMPGKYPYVGQSKFSDIIVLFNKPECGMILKGSTQYKYVAGEYIQDFQESSFIVVESIIIKRQH